MPRPYARGRRTNAARTSERFDATMEVPASGQFEWHVNQSSRPLVPGERWTLTCERPEGTVQPELSGCGSPARQRRH
jgi:hypothetical protein